MKTQILLISFLLLSSFVRGEQRATITVDVAHPGAKISRHIYGHFAEHLGRCIYDGFWIDSALNVEKHGRIRMDIVKALKEIKVPNLRWPGGCYADEYQWRDGIGNPKNRPVTINSNWGGVTEDNSFGTHEFLELCELIGCEPYISANMGTGSPESMKDWIEYLNYAGKSALTNERTLNGHPEPYGVSFWGIGNESWGCGGDMVPEYYVNEYRRYQCYARNYSGNNLKKIASGPNVDDYEWMETCMQKIPAHMMWDISLHYYTIPTGDWGKKGSATSFDENEYFDTMKRCLYMEELLNRHEAIMNKYDPQKKVSLVVDEWGIWTDVEPGTNPGFLYQQNSMRDALVAGTTLNIFNNHSDRVRMANLAQAINVLQSLVLTNKEKMLLTPTYYIFDMYKVHQDALLLPTTIDAGNYINENESIPSLNVSASKDENGCVHVSIVNLHSTEKIHTLIDMKNEKKKVVSAKLLTSKLYNDCNTFENPSKVVPLSYGEYKVTKEGVEVQLPPLSVVVLEMK
ncbi:alpha-N-arabinofuranosidase [Coprobacter secundus]|uniref:alpha-N-arabinofuranosidase n=1 Tax=Coprobacter secundus TaxID=1501392 RepID=UPI0005731D21|nr:alpha-N-arabinofuranosidase [Coprobacter secundus]